MKKTLKTSEIHPDSIYLLFIETQGVPRGAAQTKLTSKQHAEWTTRYYTWVEEQRQAACWVADSGVDPEAKIYSWPEFIGFLQTQAEALPNPFSMLSD